jgi:hypothetical protein
MSYSAVNFTSMARAYDLNSLVRTKWGVSPASVLAFLWGFDMVAPHLIFCDNMQQKCITISMEQETMFQLH